MEEERFVLRSARWLAADAIRRYLRPGDLAVDATMGNGRDTENLCRWVGESGMVYAFDIQEQALEATRERLRNAALLERAVLIHAGHEHMAEYVQKPVQAVVFNLGWLPGGKHSVTTKAGTTERAVDAALKLLCPGGLLSVCVYPGHEEGKRELAMLLSKCESLDVRRFTVLHHHFLNAGEEAPRLILVQKNPEGKASVTDA